MNVNRQLINLAGGAVTVLVLVAGILLIGLPMYTGAKSAEREAEDVARSNDTQQIVIDGLVAQAAKIADLTSELAGLREQIAIEPRVDDVVALALAAAAAEGGTVKAVNATETSPFSVRTGDEGTAPAPDAAASPVEAAENATADPAAAGTAAPDPDPAATDPAATDPAATDSAADDLQQQVAVTLEFAAPSVDAATSIVDALRSGRRVVAIIKATTTTEDESVKLSVELLVFVNRS